jgi:hypothetical protein
MLLYRTCYSAVIITCRFCFQKKKSALYLDIFNFLLKLKEFQYQSTQVSNRKFRVFVILLELQASLFCYLSVIHLLLEINKKVALLQSQVSAYIAKHRLGLLQCKNFFSFLKLSSCRADFVFVKMYFVSERVNLSEVQTEK